MNTSSQPENTAASVGSPILAHVRGLGARGNVITTAVDGRVGLKIHQGDGERSVIMSPDEAADVLHNLTVAVESLTPAAPEGLAVVAAAAEAAGVTLPDLADRSGVGRKTNLNDLTRADLGRMSRTAGTMLAERRRA
jgi:hypothetical protein